MTIADIIEKFIDLGLKVIPFLVALAFLYFIWGVARFISAQRSGSVKPETKNTLIWGVIGLFLMASLWGIITIFSQEVGFGRVGVPTIIISK